MSILSSILPTTATQPAPVLLTPAAGSSTSTSGVTFGDVMDAVNPLQHIPVVSNIYRAVTGSTISAGSKIIGDTVYGALLGGPILAGAALGFSSATADVAITQTTGSDITSHVLNTIGLGSSSATTAPTSSVASPATLVATPSANAAAIAANNSLQTPQQQAAAAAALILRPGTHPERTNAQYQRAQAFDAINKSLVKIKV